MHRGFFLPVKALPPVPNGPETGGGRCHATYLCGERFNSRPPRGERHPAWYPAESPAEFQSTPSARRATSLRETTTALMQRFQSTPSVGRATNIWAAAGTTSTYFNPRPPRGGRLHRLLCTVMPWKFQSTPSARRATRRSCRLPTRKRQFQSTPSARRATCRPTWRASNRTISIHALREEGDLPT